MSEPREDPAGIDDARLLGDMLAGARERKDWRAVAAITARLAELETDLGRRARHYHTVATLQRAELGDAEAALEAYEQALDCDPSLRDAFDEIVLMLSERGDWKVLERAHRRMIYRTGGDAALWRALGLIYRDRLDSHAAAIEALKMALRVQPDDRETAEALAELTRAGRGE